MSEGRGRPESSTPVSWVVSTPLNTLSENGPLTPPSPLRSESNVTRQFGGIKVVGRTKDESVVPEPLTHPHSVFLRRRRRAPSLVATTRGRRETLEGRLRFSEVDGRRR